MQSGKSVVETCADCACLYLLRSVDHVRVVTTYGQ